MAAKVAAFGASFVPCKTANASLFTQIDSTESLENSRSKISMVEPHTDLVLVHCHWGDEFVPLPNQSQRRIARKIIASGADVIFGHHPHVYQGCEYGDDRPVFYSLGNFISDMKQPYVRKAAMVKISYNADLAAKVRVCPTHINDSFSPKFSKSGTKTKHIMRANKFISLLDKRKLPLDYDRLLRWAYHRYRMDMMRDFLGSLSKKPSIKIRIMLDFIKHLVRRFSA